MNLIVYAIFLFLFVNVEAQGKNSMEVNSQLQSQVDDVSAKLANGEIRKIKILHMPPDILTRTRITTELLEKQFYYKLTIRDIRTTVYETTIAKAIDSVVVQACPEIADLRWAVFFYGIDNRCVSRFYFDKKGRKGMVDDVSVLFKGKLFKWLVNNFSECFR